MVVVGFTVVIVVGFAVVVVVAHSVVVVVGFAVVVVFVVVGDSANDLMLTEVMIMKNVITQFVMCSSGDIVCVLQSVELEKREFFCPPLFLSFM